MIERIRIEGYKSLRSVDVELAPLVVILGPNAAGKSNFLEALLLLSRLGTERTLGDALGGPLRGYPLEAFGLPQGGLEELLDHPTARLLLEADVRLATGAQTERRLRYRVGLEIQPKTGALSVCDEYFTRLSSRGQPLANFNPRIESEQAADGDGEEARARLVVRRLKEQGRPRYEELGLPHTLLSNLQFSGGDRYPDFDLLRRELQEWHIYYLDPRVAMRQPQPPREVFDIGADGGHLSPLLYRLKSDQRYRRNFDAIRRGLATVVPIDGLEVDLDTRRGTLDLRTIQEGTPFSSRIVSEGTLRLLALCTIAANPWRSSLVAFEEPENGVHPRRVETVASIVANMVRTDRHQVVVSTHSPAFAASVARLGRQPDFSGRVLLLRARQSGRFTELEPLSLDAPLLSSKEIQDALTDSSEELLIAKAYERGWLDA